MSKIKYYIRFLVCVIRAVAVIIGVGFEWFGYLIFALLIILSIKY